MARGDHIRVRRNKYWHHGIDCGDGTVIHYTGLAQEKVNAAVRRTAIEEFAKGAPIEPVPYRDAFDTETVVRRAESRLNERRYGLLSNNCEHFAVWCKCGHRKSRQVARAAGAAAAFAVGAASMLTLTMARAYLRRGRFI